MFYNWEGARIFLDVPSSPLLSVNENSTSLLLMKNQTEEIKMRTTWYSNIIISLIVCCLFVCLFVFSPDQCQYSKKRTKKLRQKIKTQSSNSNNNKINFVCFLPSKPNMNQIYLYIFLINLLMKLILSCVSKTTTTT